MEDRILDGSDILDMTFVEWLQLLAASGRSWRYTEETAAGPRPRARVNHARWIVDCPFCAGAELVWLADQRFLCGSCLNRDAGGRLLEVEVPAAGERKAISQALLGRAAANRNWEPGESREDLLDENEKHGIGG